MNEVVGTTHEGAVRILTLQRPEALNAFDQRLYDALTEAVLLADKDPDVSVVVLTGSGRAFSAGTDLTDLLEHGDFRRGPDTTHGFVGLIDSVLALRKPLICAVNGIAVGLGATLLALADLVFLSQEARIRCPFTALGLAPEAASSVTMPQLMGRQNASWTLLSSEWLDAEECLRAGLGFRVLDANELMHVTLAHAQSIAAHPLESLIATKRLIARGLEDSARAALMRESAAFDELLVGPAHKDALRAFHDRKRPAAERSTNHDEETGQ